MTDEERAAPMSTGRLPCRSQFGGRQFDAACDECDHALIAHRMTDKVCSICEAVEQVAVETGLPVRPDDPDGQFTGSVGLPPGHALVTPRSDRECTCSPIGETRDGRPMYWAESCPTHDVAPPVAEGSRVGRSPSASY